MMWLGVVLGLRWVEAAGLTFCGFNRKTRTVAVQHQLGRDGELVPPKSAASRRTMACPKWLADDLAALIARRGLTQAAPTPSYSSSPTIDPWTTATGDAGSGYRDSENAGLPELRFHDLRSMAATLSWPLAWT